MGEIPHGQPPPSTRGFPVYDLGYMRDHKDLRAGEPAGPQTRCETNPARPTAVILGVDDEMGIRESSAEVLIRYKTHFLVKNTTIDRDQNQAGNAASECLLQNLLSCPTSHN